MEAITLDSAGNRGRIAISPTPHLTRPTGGLRTRRAYAAAHVVPLVHAANTPGAPAQVDWDATLGFRRHLWSWGLGVADAMDTAQRNMGLDWPATTELIRRSAAEARACDGDVVVGVNTDHLPAGPQSLNDIADAYLHQAAVASDAGAGVVLMASRHLAAAARGPEDYLRVYSDVLSQLTEPVTLHWLGPVFDAQLTGYFGSTDYHQAAITVLDIIGSHPHVTGIKMSLLDDAAERDLRARLPQHASMLTGDDYHYVDLIAGDGTHHSDALLGAFAALGPLASSALTLLDDGDEAGYRNVLGPTEALSQHIFAAPTEYYKTGIAFLAWLNGHQQHPFMVGGLHAGRDLPHLSRTLELASQCGALERPELAVSRWHCLLDTAGVL